MSFWDYLTAGKKYRDTDDDYGREYSRPRRVMYEVYCKKCGAYARSTSPSDAVRELQDKDVPRGYNSSLFCGRGKHITETREVEN